MRNHLVLSVAIGSLALVSSANLRPLEAQVPGNGPGYVANEVIVKYRVGASEADRVRARGRVNGTALDNLARTPAAAAAGALELLQVPAGLTVRDAIIDLLGDPSVEYAEPNWIYTRGGEPCQLNWNGVGDCTADPSFDQLWGLHNTGQALDNGAYSGGTADADIDAPEAWATTTGSASIHIGVIDEGIDFSHPDLAGQIWTNPYDPPDGKDNDNNGYVDDIHGWDFAGNNNSIYDPKGKNDAATDAHGTHVAGTIGAKTNNSAGVAGVSWNVTIISAKFLGPRGGTTANAIKAVDYFTNLKSRPVNPINIVATNNSWGGGGYSQALFDAIVRAARANILFIAAAGNGGADSVGDNNDAVASYPSNYNTTAAVGYDAVIAVAATGRFDDLRTFSNYGPVTVDIAAPGSLILSTTPKSTYEYYAGTSMATPHVTGAVALVKAARPTLLAADLKSVILKGADRLQQLQGKISTGARLNVHASMTVAP